MLLPWYLPAATLTHAALVALTGVVLSLLAVDEVQTLGLNLTVDEGTGETSDDLLGLGVVVNLACSRVSEEAHYFAFDISVMTYPRGPRAPRRPSWPRKRQHHR